MSISHIQYFFEIIKSILNNTPFDTPGEGVNFERLYSFAESHGMSGIMGWCEKAFVNAPPELRQKLIYEKNFSIAREATQEIVISSFLDEMEKNSLRAMPLKGFCIKNLYPHPAMRTMGDTDILVDGDDMDKIKTIMEALGLMHHHNSENEVVFKNSQMMVELHTDLIAPVMGRLFDYYKDNWQFAKLCTHRKYVYEMTPEDFYIFAITHIARHYSGGGIGIRQIMDIYVLLKNKYDWDYINAELEKLDLCKFGDLVKELSLVWFGKEKNRPFNPDVAELGRGILESGAFGNGKDRAISGVYRKKYKIGVEDSGIKTLLRRIFPSMKSMQVLHPVLKKYGFLYPVFWVIRAIDICLHRQYEIKNMGNIASIKTDDVEEFAEKLKRVGIPTDL